MMRKKTMNKESQSTKQPRDKNPALPAKSGPMPDYRIPSPSKKDILRYAAEYFAAAAAIIWLFYDRWILLLFAAPGALIFVRHCAEKQAEARRTQLSYTFRDALDSLSVSLKAGYSVENAFPQAARDLASVLGRDADITCEIRYIAQQCRMSVPAENLLLDLARRSGSEDIRNFAAVFSAAKRMGGNMPAIIRSAAETIGGRIEVSREIDTVLAAKRMEQKIMTAMPCGILLYMRLASPGFLDLMYTTGLGAAIMTVCLIAYGGAVLIGRKIIAIEV